MKYLHSLTIVAILSISIVLIGYLQESPAPLVVSVSADSSAFSDTKGTWAESSISRGSKLGLINGYRDGSFRPQNSISSIECYAIAFRAFSHIANPTDGSDWSVPYLNFYTSEGFDTKVLKPIVTQKDEPITREKALYVLLRAKGVNFTKVEELKFSRSFTGTLFPDVKRTDSYAKYILYAKERGIVNGQSDGKFGFGRPITRAELTVIALRLMDFKIIDGACGEANDKKEGFSVAPTAWLCDAGLSGPMTESATGWSWSCNVTNGGKNASCQAKRSKTVMEAASTDTKPCPPWKLCLCGKATEIPSSVIPRKNLCNGTNTASSISTGTINGMESWKWTCSNDTATESCSTHHIYIQKSISITKLSSSDTGNSFGYATAISGDTAVVGAHDVGNAYIFTRSGATWSETKKLDGSSIVGKKTLFGHAVAISGDTMAVGWAPAPSGGTTGAVYVFERSADNWDLTAVLTPEKSDTVNNTKFGYSSIAIDGGTIVVGTGDRDTEYRSGVKEAAYVFIKSGDAWIQKQKLLASDSTKDDHFGTSVAMSGDTILIGAFGVGHKNPDTTDRESKWAAYVFTRTNNTWTQTDKITPSDLQYGDQFGISIAIDRTTAVIGTKHRDPNAHPASVYVYEITGGKWMQRDILTTGESRSCDLFGSSVSISGDTIIAPSYRTCNDGVVIRMFTRNAQDQWSNTLKSSVTEDDVGVFSSAVSGNLAIMGMPLVGSAQKNAYIVELPKQ